MFSDQHWESLKTKPCIRRETETRELLLSKLTVGRSFVVAAPGPDDIIHALETVKTAPDLFFHQIFGTNSTRGTTTHRPHNETRDFLFALLHDPTRDFMQNRLCKKHAPQILFCDIRGNRTALDPNARHPFERTDLPCQNAFTPYALEKLTLCPCVLYWTHNRHEIISP